MKKIFINIKQIIKAEIEPLKKHCGDQMKQIGTVDNAFLLIEKGKIVDFGKMQDINLLWLKECEIIDLQNTRYILPGFVDSHTHTVFATTRENEFVDKIQGLTYEQIAERGGGILNSAKKIAEISEQELYEISKKRILELMKMGTIALEIKSGYGLYTEGELKMLRVINKLKNDLPIDIVPTYLCAHAIPLEYRQNKSKYIDYIINETMPAVAEEKLAKFIDIFCEQGFFNVEDTERLLVEAQKYGFVPKLHANQLAVSGGVQVGVKFNGLSVDHLENITEIEIEALKNTQTMPTILPGCAFYLNLPLTPVRKMIDNGLPVAMSSDFNPGSSPSGNMKLVMSMACIRYKMLPNEALNAVTQNTAYAIGLEKELGSISVGKNASFIVTEPIPSFEYFPYYFGKQLIEKVFVKGQEI